jgi:hypothetical protein
MCSKFGSLVLGIALTGLATLSVCGSAYATIIPVHTYTFDLYISDGSGDYINLDLTTDKLPGPLGGAPSSGAPITDITGNAFINGIDFSASGPNSGPNLTADNLLYSNSPFVDALGIGFDLTPILITVDDPPYVYAGGNLTCAGGQTGCPDFTPSIVQLSQVATPLPAALPLFATGLGVMGLLGSRRKRKNSAASAAV